MLAEPGAIRDLSRARTPRLLLVNRRRAQITHLTLLLTLTLHKNLMQRMKCASLLSLLVNNSPLSSVTSAGLNGELHL